MFEISIIICSYNRANLLDKGLYTWINQNFDDDKYEIIVVDDGSTDNTKEIVEKYKSVKYVYRDNKDYSSPSSARNFGVKSSQSKYIVFTDPESLIPYDYLKIAYDFHEATEENWITTFFPLMLTKQDLEKLDNINWKNNPLLIDQIVTKNSEDNVYVSKRKTWRDNNFSMFERKSYNRISGVNENFTKWGYEGIDFVERMMNVGGCKLYNFPKLFIYHLWHELVRDLNKAEYERAKYGIKDCGKHDK